MNRRTFLKSSATSAAALALAPALLSGCTASEVEQYLNTVLASGEAILGLTSSNDSWFADLQSAVAALKATEGTWSASTVTAVVVSALNTLDAILAVIPVTASFSPLIDVLTTAIETILTTFVAPTTSLTVKLTASNPHRNKVALKRPHALQSKIGAYKAQWNDLVVGLQLPASARL